MSVSLRELALYATLLNKVKKTVRKKKPDLVKIHLDTLDRAKKLFNEHVNTERDLQDIVIDPFTLGEESDHYSIQFLDSYLGSQDGKTKRDPIYKDLDNIRCTIKNREGHANGHALIDIH